MNEADNLLRTILDIILRTKKLTSLDIDQDLLGHGFLDSFDIVSIVLEIENIFQIAIPGDKITPENFKTAKSIALLVSRL